MYGLRYKSTKSKNKWLWHRNREGAIVAYEKETAERLASLWDKSLVKVQKITAKSK